MITYTQNPKTSSASYLTEPGRKAFHMETYCVALAGDKLRPKQGAGELPPVMPDEMSLIVSYVAAVPVNGVRFTGDAVRALCPFTTEREAADAP